MSFGKRIADLTVGIGVDDAEFQAEMRAAEQRALGMVRKIDGQRAEVEITADLKGLEEKEKRAELILDRWRRKRAEATLDLDVKKADAQVRRWETRLKNLTNRKHQLHMELNERQATAGIVRLGRELRRLKKTSDENDKSFRKLFQSITSMTLRLGPFTAQVQQFAKALLLTGPVVQGLLGALGSLISVVGAGLIGAVGLGAASLTGMALAGTGLYLALRPLGQQLQAVQKAQNAYTTAVDKYGAKSKQAVKAQQQLNSVLAHVSPTARQGFRDMGRFNQEFQRMTAPTRRAALEVMGQAFKTLQALMPTLAHRTNQVATILATKMGGALKALRGSGGKGLVDSIFGGFNASLPHFLSGLQALATAAARFIAAFAGSPLRGVSGDFEKFAQGVERASRDGGKLAHIASSTTSAFETTIHVLSAASKLLFQFFRAGLGPGNQFASGLADSMDKLAAKIGTVTGQNKLRDWFQNGIQTTRELFAALQPLLGLFQQFTEIMLPFSNAALHIADALASVTKAISNLGVVGPILQGIFGYELVRALPLVGKVLPSIGRVLGGLGKAGGGRILGGFAAEAAGGAAAGGTLVRIFGALREASLGARFGVAGLAVALGLVTANALGLKTLGARLHDEFNKLGKTANENSNAYVTLRGRLADVGSALQESKLNLRQARTELAGTKKGTIEHAIALQQYRDALRQNAQAQRDWTTGSRAMKQAADQELMAQEQRLTTFDKAHEKQIAELKDQRQYAANAERRKQADTQLNMLQGKRNAILESVIKAQNRDAAAVLNAQRVYRGLLPVVGQAEQTLGKLSQRNPNIAKKISLKFDTPKSAGAVLGAALSALKAGASAKIVMKIVADSKNAEQAVRRLNALHPRDKNINVTAHDRATGILSRVQAKKIADKVFGVHANAGQALSAITAVQNLMASLHDKTLTISILKSSAAIPAGKHALGRGPGADELALVGEGNGPELVADPASGRSALVREPTLMSLPRSAYVVPAAADAGQQRQQRLFEDAARAMGIPGFKKGKKGKKGHEGKKDLGHVPTKIFHFGGFPEDKVKNALDAEQSKLHDLQDKQKHKKATAGQVAKEASLVKRLRTDYLQAHSFANRVTLLETRLNTTATAMNNANATGDAKKWTRAHDRRTSILRQLIGSDGNSGVLNKAEKLAAKYGQRQYAAELAGKIEDLRGDLISAKSGPDSAFAPEDAPDNLEDFLKAVGLFGSYQNFQLALSQAQGTDDLGDDRTALTNLQGFLDSILQRGDLSVAARIDAQDTRNEIHGELAGLASSGPSGDQQAIIDQLQTRLNTANNEAAINAAFAQVAGGPGDIGTGYASGRMAAAPTFVINTLHPGDSRTLRAISGAAASGFGYQGGRPPARVNLGY